MARPTKRTPGTVKVIIDAIEKGAFDYVAAQAAGIAPSTFREWLKDDEFSAQVAGARARARLKAEALVFGGNPLAWLTKGPGRRTGEPSEVWADAHRVELSGPDGGPIRSAGPDLSKLSPAELRQLRQLTAKAEGSAS